MLRHIRGITAITAVVLLLTVCSSLRATVVAPGGSIGPPAVIGSLPPGAATATISGGYSMVDAFFNVTGTGTYSVKVWSPDTGTGFTTFVMNVAVATGEVGRLTMTNFAGFTTDVFAFGAGTNATTVDRSPTGGTVGFNFASALQPGASTVQFVIRTNSPTYATGSLQIIDGGVANEISFAPVPLPAAAWAGLALMGFVTAKKLHHSRRFQV